MRLTARSLVPTICALMFVAAVPSTGHAQVALTAAGGVFGFSGDDFEDVESGFGAEGGISTRLSDSFSLAGVFHWTAHDLAGTSASINYIALMAQPLIHFGDPGGLDVFVGARGGYGLLSSVDLGGADDRDTITGLVVGPVAGIAVPVGGNSSLGVGGTWTLLSLSDDNSGSGWGLGAFFSLGL